MLGKRQTKLPTGLIGLLHIMHLFTCLYERPTSTKPSLVFLFTINSQPSIWHQQILMECCEMNLWRIKKMESYPSMDQNLWRIILQPRHFVGATPAPAARRTMIHSPWTSWSVVQWLQWGVLIKLPEVQWGPTYKFCAERPGLLLFKRKLDFHNF